MHIETLWNRSKYFNMLGVAVWFDVMQDLSERYAKHKETALYMCVMWRTIQYWVGVILLVVGIPSTEKQPYICVLC